MNRLLYAGALLSLMSLYALRTLDPANPLLSLFTFSNTLMIFHGVVAGLLAGLLIAGQFVQSRIARYAMAFLGVLLIGFGVSSVLSGYLDARIKLMDMILAMQFGIVFCVAGLERTTQEEYDLVMEKEAQLGDRIPIKALHTAS